MRSSHNALHSLHHTISGKSIMLTIFSIPKPFIGHIGLIQRNAIISWLHLIPKCEIILFGDEPGIQEIAQEFGIRHVPDIRKNEYGTPFLDDVFNQARKTAHHDILCYCNADIIFFNDILESIKKIPVREYLMVGERWDVDVTTPIDTTRENWAEEFSLLHGSIIQSRIFPAWIILFSQKVCSMNSRLLL